MINSGTNERRELGQVPVDYVNNCGGVLGAMKSREEFELVYCLKR